MMWTITRMRYPACASGPLTERYTMACDKFVEYDLKAKTATQHIEDYRLGIDGDWFNDRSLNEIVADFAERMDQLIVKWQNKPVKIDSEYIEADSSRKYDNREVTFTDLKLSWELCPYGQGEMGLYLNGIRPVTPEELEGLEFLEQQRQDQQRSWRQAEYDKLKAEFEI